MSKGLAEINCPTRRKPVSILVCHTCANYIRVQFKSEMPPELQCARWDWEKELSDGGDRCCCDGGA